MDNLKIQEHVPLKPFTSMHVGGNARYFAEVRTEAELLEALSFARGRKLRIFILGGGSNIIVKDTGFDGLVIRMQLTGIRLIGENESHADFEVGSGENWDDFVRFAVDKNLFGIENLSHIPGSVGASVVQNIGAYGQEVSESVLQVRVVSIQSMDFSAFSRDDMNFSYRKSRLNRIEEDKGKYAVVSVTFRLKKSGEFKTAYNDIKKYFLESPGIELNSKNLRSAIISIRDAKFPFPNSPDSGSVGSFWNADPISEETYENIIHVLRKKGFDKKADEMEGKKDVFRIAQGYKVPYGAFVELLGFKGRKIGGAKILESHAGVINNFSGTATASDVLALSQEVIEAVYREFGIRMNIEPEIVS